MFFFFSSSFPPFKDTSRASSPLYVQFCLFNYFFFFFFSYGHPHTYEILSTINTHVEHRRSLVYSLYIYIIFFFFCFLSFYLSLPLIDRRTEFSGPTKRINIKIHVDSDIPTAIIIRSTLLSFRCSMITARVSAFHCVRIRPLVRGARWTVSSRFLRFRIAREFQMVARTAKMILHFFVKRAPWTRPIRFTSTSSRCNSLIICGGRWAG